MKLEYGPDSYPSPGWAVSPARNASITQAGVLWHGAQSPERAMAFFLDISYLSQRGGELH